MAFTFNTVKNFDEHISKSIPNYEGLDKLITHIALSYVSNESSVIDLGCSTGRMLKQIRAGVIKNKNMSSSTKYIEFLGVDNSLLLPENDETVKDDAYPLEFFNKDLTLLSSNTPPFQNKFSSVILSIFTMQFLDYPDKKNYLKFIQNSLADNGICIMAEKVMHDDVILNNALTLQYHEWKRNNFKDSEIMNKALDLGYNMKCLTRSNLEEMFSENFDFTPIWQNGLFSAYILSLKK